LSERSSANPASRRCTWLSLTDVTMHCSRRLVALLVNLL
jgi:hypothetical protein